MSNENGAEKLEVLQIILDALERVNQGDREVILRTVYSFYEPGGNDQPRGIMSEPRRISNRSTGERELNFADRAILSPKEFLHDKQPQTDIERVACLAYYLSHYRDTPHFKTIDISKLNTEAAQLKFSNPASVVANAASSGLLTPAGKGKKQISAIGERFVDALPDRENAKAVVGRMRPRRGRKKSSDSKEPGKTNR